MEIRLDNGTLVISGLTCFDLARSCECGQAFRWYQQEDGGYLGVASGRAAYLAQQKDTLVIYPCKDDEIPFWLNYLDLQRDYTPIEDAIRNCSELSACASGSCGIHVFHQEPFETLISFIISANNNVKRIMSTVKKICALAGKPFDSPFGIQYAFPTPEALAACTEEALRACGMGYRAPYIRETAAMIRDGYSLEKLEKLSLAEARNEIKRLPGVGPKVGDCVLLFSLGHEDAFPMDVWMKRAMRTLFFAGQEPCKAELEQAINRLGPQAGIIQQYLFYYARSIRMEG